MDQSSSMTHSERHFNLKHLIIGALVYVTLAFAIAPQGFKAQPSEDTYEYAKPARAIVAGIWPNFEIRSPTYPLFLVPSVYFSSNRLLWLMQLGLGALAFFLYAKVIRKNFFKNQPTTALFMSILTWAPVQVMGWSGYALSESLMIAFLLIWIWLDQTGSILSCCLFYLAFIMLRPAFAPWPLLVYGFRLIKKRQKDSFIKLTWALSVVLGFCTYLYCHSGHFEFSMTGRTNRLSMILNYGKLDFHLCEHQICDPITRDTLKVILDKNTIHDDINFGFSKKLSSEKILIAMHRLRPVFTLNGILDHLLTDLSPSTRFALTQHIVVQFFLNVSNGVTAVFIDRLQPQFQDFFVPWSKVCRYWEYLFAGGVLLLLTQWKTVKNQPLLQMFFALWIFQALIVAAFSPAAFSRLMAPALVPFHFLGLYGLFTFIKSNGDKPLPPMS